MGVALIGAPEAERNDIPLALIRLERWKRERARRRVLLQLRDRMSSKMFATPLVLEHERPHPMFHGLPDAARCIQRSCEVHLGQHVIRIPGHRPFQRFDGLRLTPHVNQRDTQVVVRVLVIHVY